VNGIRNKIMANLSLVVLALGVISAVLYLRGGEPAQAGIATLWTAVAVFGLKALDDKNAQIDQQRAQIDAMKNTMRCVLSKLRSQQPTVAKSVLETKLREYEAGGRQ